MNNELVLRYANEKIDDNLVQIFNFLLEVAKSVNSKNASLHFTDELVEMFNNKDYKGIRDHLDDVKGLLEVLDKMLDNCLELEEKIKKLTK